MDKPHGELNSELNNKFLTISVSDSFRDMVNRLHWQLKISKSRLLREVVLFYAKSKNLEGNQNENKEG